MQLSSRQCSSAAAQQACTIRRPFAAAAAAAPALIRRQAHSSRTAAVTAFAAYQGFSTAAAAASNRQLSSSASRRASRSSRLVVRANWGAPVEFSSAKVVSNSRVAEKLHKVVVDVGELAGGYQKGGQFMQIKVGEGKPGFFAISSPPDPNNQGLLEFLIKAQGEAAEALAALSAGAEVSVSPVQGKGFPVEKIPAEANPTVLLFATGSGISPIKALIESGQLEADKRSDVRLYYGTRDADHTAFAECIPAWEKSGVKVIQVYSNDADNSTKYVQDVFKAQPGLGSADKGKGVGVVLCGHKDMCNAVKEIVAAEGVEADKVLLNF